MVNKVHDMRARGPWEYKNNQRQTQGPGSLKNKQFGNTKRRGSSELFKDPDKGELKYKTGFDLLPRPPGKIGNDKRVPMPALPPVEIEKRLKKIG